MRRHDRFVVDWSDPSFPEVRLASEGEPADLRTFSQAREDIVAHFERIAEHAHAEIIRARMLRRADIDNPAENNRADNPEGTA